MYFESVSITKTIHVGVVNFHNFTIKQIVAKKRLTNKRRINIKNVDSQYGTLF